MSLMLVLLAAVFLPMLLSRLLVSRVRSRAATLMAGGALPLVAFGWLAAGRGTSPGEREAFAYGVGGLLVLWVADTVVAALAVRALDRKVAR